MPETMGRAIRGLLVIGIAVAHASCATLADLGFHPPDGGRRCPGPLVPSEDLPDDLLLRVQAHVQGDGVDYHVTLVARTRGGVLALAGLDGFGSRVFALRQRGTEIELERSPGRALPWPPENLLRDLHAIRFFALRGRPLADRPRAGAIAGVEIEERWTAGRFEARTLALPRGGAVTVRAGAAPGGFALEHPSCGYVASYALSESLLESTRGAREQR
jgi:hypothetical protein